MVNDKYRSPSSVNSEYIIPAEDSDTFATSCPVAINIAVMPLGECRPVLFTPDKNEPIAATLA